MDKKLSQNVSVKIGGKNFSINDIEKYKPQHKEEHSISNMEHAPRDIRKTLQNEANTIKTNIQVQKNTDVSLSHFANVKGTEKIALPGSSAIGFTNSVQTASETVRAAENRAEQAIQETSYKPSHIVNNTVTSKAEGSNRIQSSLSSIPIVADSVSDNAAKPETFALPLVGTSLSHSSGVIGTGGFKANLTDGSAIGLAHNIQTASETTRATENRVIHTTQETTYKPSHIINNAAVLKAQSASIPDVENEIRSTPYFSTPVVAGNVPNLGTGSNRIQSSLSSISPIVADSVSDNAPKPEIYAKPLVSTSLPHSSGVIGIGSFKANLTGGSAIGFAHNIQTASETARATENRVVHTTQETTYKPSHIITNAAVPKTQQTQQITASIPDEENENRSMPSFSIPVVAGNVQNRGGYTIGMAYLTTGLTKYNNDYARRIKDIENLEIAVDIAKKRAETSLNNASELFIKFNANPTVKASELWQTAYNDYLKDYDDFKKTNRTYIQKYNSLSDHGVTTYRMLKTAAEQRVLQSTMRTNYTFFGLIKNAQIEAKASLLESLSKYRIQSPPISTLSLTGNALASGGKQIVGKVEGLLSNQNDFGAKTAIGIMKTVSLTYSTFKLAQDASPLVVNAIKGKSKVIVNTVKKTIDIINTASKATITVTNTFKIASNFSVPIFSRKALEILRSQAIATKLNATKLSQAIVKSVNKIQHRVTQIQHGVSQIKTGAEKTIRVVRGITNGTIHTSVVASHILSKVKNVTIKGLKITGKAALTGVTRFAVKGLTRSIVKGIPKLSNVTGDIALGAAGLLSRTDNFALQGMGGAINLANYSIRTSITAGKVTGRVVQTSVKGAIKTGKVAVQAVSFIKNNGLKAAWQKARQKAEQMLFDAGKSFVSALINIIKALGQKVILPLILIICAIVAVQTLLGAPMQALGAIFGGIFNTVDDEGNYTEFNVRDYLLNPTSGLPVLRDAYLSDLNTYIESQYIDNGGSYHIVRLKIFGSPVEISDISSSFISLDNLVNIVQPIFNAVVLKDYGLELKESEAEAILKDIFDKLFSRSEESTTEWCTVITSVDDDADEDEDSTDTPYIHSCGRIHALSDCYNIDSGVHDGYFCSTCCYYICNGHTSTTYCSDEDCTGHTSTTYCSGCVHMCSGYEYCAGHEVLTVTVTVDGIHRLLQEYFLDPMEQLLNLSSRTEEQDNELQTLQDYYEICLEYIAQVSIAYGGGLTLDDLNDVDWVTGSRAGNSVVVELGLSQVGQAGGYPYWSYYGFLSRVEWCACFVHWCYNISGYGSDYGLSSNNAYCPTLVNYFKSRGVWQNSNYTDLAIGDVIFFDWECDGTSDHVGLVIGRDSDYVYTVEGNSGDVVKIRKYHLGSSVIMGYATFNS